MSTWITDRIKTKNTSNGEKESHLIRDIQRMDLLKICEGLVIK